MPKKVYSDPNNQIAIICTRSDNKNNTYTIVPLEIALGKLDENGYFNSENGEYHLPCIENYDSLLNPNIDTFYGFLESYETLSHEYKIEDVESIMAKYYIDKASKLLVALADNGIVRVYDTEYENVSDEIKGSLSKRYEEPLEECYEPDDELDLDLERDAHVTPRGDLDLIDNEDLERYLKERILENDDIIEDIVTTIAMNYSATNPRDVKAMLSIGPTGSGKTETFNLIAEYLGVVLTMFDCTQLTASGYVGKDIDDICRKIYFNCGRNSEVASKSILVLDEIDKIAGRGNDVTDVNVQYELLKFIEGAQYNFELERKSGGLAGTASIDTSFMTIAGLGAFSEIFEKKKRTSKLGFSQEKESLSDIEVTQKDLIEYGLVDQLLGRFALVNQYKELDAETLKKILVTAKNSPLLRKMQRYQEQFKTELGWDDTFIEALVDFAIKQKNGARGLNKAVDRTFTKLDRALYTELRHSEPKAKRLVLTSDIVENPSKFNL